MRCARRCSRRSNEPKRVVPPEPAPHVSPLIRPWFGVSRGAGRQDARDVRLGAGGTRARRPRAPSGLAAGADRRDRPTAPCCSKGRWRRPGRRRSTIRAATPSRAVFDDAAGPPAAADVDPGRRGAACSIRTCARCRCAICAARSRSARREVLRARNAREFRTLEAEAAVPVASREFSRTERLLIRFQAYGPAGAPPTVSAKLLGRAGRRCASSPSPRLDARRQHDRPAARRAGRR